MKFKVGDKVHQKRDLRKWGYVRDILEHPAYGQSYLIWWGYSRTMGEGWCDHDLS